MKPKKLKKRRRAVSESEDDEIDLELQKQLEERLAAHCKLGPCAAALHSR